MLLTSIPNGVLYSEYALLYTVTCTMFKCTYILLKRIIAILYIYVHVCYTNTMIIQKSMGKSRHYWQAIFAHNRFNVGNR